MAITPMSSDASVAQTAQTNNVQKQDTQRTAAKTTDQKAVQQVNADTVKISNQAAQLASQQYSQQEELKETSTKKGTESAQGKR